MHTPSLGILRPAHQAMLVLAAAALSACGGSSSTGGGQPASSLVGTAAIGAAMANADVTVTDRSGGSACSNDPVRTDASGAYRCVLKSTTSAPWVIVASDPDGLISPMVSFQLTMPAAGSEAVSNITPLTTAIAAQMDPGKDAFALVKDPAALADLDATAFDAITTNVVNQLADVLVDADLNPATFDPFTTPFVGGSGTAADELLDQIRITFDNGVPSVANVLNPDAPAVPLADASAVSAPKVSTSVVDSSFSLRELDFAKTELERCFAVPAESRAPEPDTVHRLLTGVAPACEDFAASAGDAPNVDIDFKHNGYAPEAYFYDLLTSADMDGAQFNLPELLRYTPRMDGRDEALINLKFRDKNGFVDNRILSAKKFPGSRASGTQWWLIGNQREVDSYIRATIRQREQTLPASVLDTNPAFNNAARSRFEVGLEIYVQRPNNGGTVDRANNPNNAIRYVRIKGPGLPTDGLVLGDVAPSMPQHWMGILNATGAIPSGPAELATTTSNVFRIQRTQGIVGAAAMTLRPNPGVGSASVLFNEWAHPTMYGEAPSATWQFDLTQVPAWSLYNVEAFCESAVTPCHTFATRISTPVVPATFAATQPWHSFSAASRAFVSDGAAATGSADIAWTPNALAERIGSVNAYSFSPLGQVNSFSTVVPKGSFSRTVQAEGGVFPAISVDDPDSGRTLQIRHTMFDGSFKDHLIHFN